MKVFISYGRKDALDFAKRLAADLEERASHRVFLDLENIEVGGLWEARVEQGIRGSNVVAAVMTPQALREESVCRDEVAFALNEQKAVVPLKTDPDPSLKPSLLLARRNWIDFSADYEVVLAILLRYLEGDESALRPPALQIVGGVTPLDFGPEIARHTADFMGREWVRSEIDGWLASDSRPAMVIVSEPGLGKSAIAAWLGQTRSDVAAITPDGEVAISGSLDQTLKVLNLRYGDEVATFHGDSAITCCAVVDSSSFIAGELSGRIHFLRLEGID